MNALLTVLVVMSTTPEAPRLRQAREDRAAEVRALFRGAGVAYPPAELFLRVIKDEDVLELWAAGRRGQPMRQLHRFAICARSGGPGPKRKQGDGQVPEGFYVIDRFNPWSQFHLSLGIDYPNASDRLRASGDPGGDIFIHGGCATIGCVPLEDGPMELLFVIATDTVARRIPVHVFPSRLTQAKLASLGEEAPHRAFWSELLPGYRAFEETRRPPKVSVDPKSGAYRVRSAAPARASHQQQQRAQREQ